MLRFLANNIDQLDLALEHIAKGNVNDARFGMMLTDNVVEITLHQIATDRLSDLKRFGYMRKEYSHVRSSRSGESPAQPVRHHRFPDHDDRSGI